MKIALWIIAICEVIRTAQSTEQIKMFKKAADEDKARKDRVSKNIDNAIANLERKMGVEE